jgi:cell division protein FtsW (lipid II flippase)
MSRESLLPFLPAALSAVAASVTAAIVRAKQPDYPNSVIVFQIFMFGAALLAAVPRKWVQFAGFLLLLVGVFIAGFSVGYLYLPAIFAVVWLMVRDVPPSV